MEDEDYELRVNKLRKEVIHLTNATNTNTNIIKSKIAKLTNGKVKYVCYMLIPIVFFITLVVYKPRFVLSKYEVVNEGSFPVISEKINFKKVLLIDVILSIGIGIAILLYKNKYLISLLS